jgi:UDP-N-acetylmuramoyl-tripeptide--D-alanyl-D-alanine ligase
MIDSLYKIFQQYPQITTDSRRITEGCLFFALKGETFDGNAFAEKALADGAAYAIIDNPDFKKNDRFILVKDVLKTLQQLATHHRRQFDFPVIGIAGSNGKTTTKELVSAVMSKQYKAHFTKGNLNNHIGVPLTLLELNENHEVAIVEMGANHQEELWELCEIAEPTHGLITNIGKEHLEGFGGFEGVKKGESEIYHWLVKHNGTVFVNDDEEFLHELLPKDGIRVVNYHQQHQQPSLEHPAYEITLESAAPYLKVGFLNVKGEMLHAQSHLIGDYNFGNLSTAIAIGKYFKVPSSKIKEAIENYKPSMNRSQVMVLKNGATIILDAYNANPTSMQHALRSLAKMPQKNKIAIIGDMFELGEYSENEHHETLEIAKALNFKDLVTVGKLFFSVNTEGVLKFEKTEEAKAWFQKKRFGKTTCILIKASRSMRLETLLT